MALDIQNTTFTGEFAGRYINAAFLTARTLQMDGVKKMLNIKFRQVVQNLDAGDVIDFSACDYPANTFDLNTNEVVIEPVELQTTLTLCKQEFHNDWNSKYQFMGANDNIPDTFEMYLLAYVGGLIGSGIEEVLWRGDYDATGGTSASAGNQNLTRFNGLATLFSDATAGNRVGGGQVNASTPLAGTVLGQLPASQDITAALSAATAGSDYTVGTHPITQTATVKGEFKSIIDAIPSAVYSKSPSALMIYVGLGTVRTLVDAYGSTDNGINDQQNMWWSGGFSGLTYNGVPIFVANGLTGATNPTAIATYKDNLIFGTGLMNDMNEATVIDLAKVDGSRNVRIIYRYTAGTQVGNIRDGVFYSRAVTSA